MTSKVVQESSWSKVTFFMLRAVSASSAELMLGDTYRRVEGSEVTHHSLGITTLSGELKLASHTHTHKWYLD